MRRADWLLHQLPVGMADDEFLVRFLSIFQDVADTVVDQLDALPHLFDPTVAPPVMVRALGAWVGLNWVDPSVPEELQREYVRQYFSLLQWRGTKRGLRQLLEVISRGPAEIHDTGGVFVEGEAPTGEGHVVLRVESPGRTTPEDLLRIIRSELPASVTFELYVADRQVWPTAPPIEPDDDARTFEEVH